MLRAKLLSPDEDGNQGGGGSGPNVDELVKQVGTLTEQVKLLAQGYGNIDTVVKGLGEKLGSVDEMKEALEKAREGGGGAAKSGIPDDSELDTLSRRELIALIESRVGGQIDKSLGPIKSGIEKAFSRMDEKEAMDSVTTMKAENKDFMEWKNEIGGILKANPELSVRRAYLLARAENATKAGEMDQKFKPKGDEGSGFTGGFFPTSSRTVRSTKMNPSQAAEAAWDTVMANLGGDAEGIITTH